MRSVLQAYAFWPGCSRDIGAFVKRCSACTVYQIKPDAPPFVPMANLACGQNVPRIKYTGVQLALVDDYLEKFYSMGQKVHAGLLIYV